MERKLSDGFQCLYFDLLPSSVKNYYAVSMYAHIRLNCLEEKYTPYHPYIDEKQAKKTTTLAVRCDNTNSDETFYVSRYVDDSNLAELSELCVVYIKRNVIPFFAEYYSVNRLVKAFQEKEHTSWGMGNKNTPYLVRLSAFAIEKNWREFDVVAEEYLEFCRKPHFAKNKPIAESVIEGLSRSRL